jgi:UDP-glucose 4-epimerase
VNVPINAIVTGGAGFIGSHVVDQLLSLGSRVTVYDNFSTGNQLNLAAHSRDPRLKIVRGDTLDLGALQQAMAGADTVFHFQANADVRGGIQHTRIDLEQNTISTWNVLDAMRTTGAKTLVFASSATVYGEPSVFPTPEDIPLIQTSLYGASKAAGESMIHAYAEYFGLRTLCFRFVSWIGPRYSHGVVVDFLKKLHGDPTVMEILGDGSQQKSYLDVRDGIAGIFMALQRAEGSKSVFNLGHDDFINVMEVARIVIDEAGLRGVRLQTTGGKRGWLGDSPMVHLDTSRVKQLGWGPKIPIEEGIRSTVRHLKANPALFARR